MSDEPEQTREVAEPIRLDEAPAVEANVKDEAKDASFKQDENSKKVTLADLAAKGTALYAHKKFEEAAEIFSRASDMQAELNGELAPENGEILFHYGRSLFRVGQSKSDVLGAPAATESKASNAVANGTSKAATESQKITQEGIAIAFGQGEASKDGVIDAKKPLFQFTGDENFDDSDEEEGDENEEAAEEEEEDDDLSTAFQILDLAKVCYGKQLEQLKQSDATNEASHELSLRERHIKERLADTHDALAEISLENEGYPRAIEDGRTSLNFKIELYPEDSEILAEAHYKLSLALEFASITESAEEGPNQKRAEMDQELRDEAVKEMELAIKSSRLKLQAKEVEVATMASPEDNELTRKAITEMKEIIADMEQRVVDLRKNPIDAEALLGPEANALGGVFGAALGESGAETQARVEEAKKNAKDLTNLVRKKTKQDEASSSSANGKRKAEEALGTGAESPKKAKVEDGDQ